MTLPFDDVRSVYGHKVVSPGLSIDNDVVWAMIGPHVASVVAAVDKLELGIDTIQVGLTGVTAKIYIVGSNQLLATGSALQNDFWVGRLKNGYYELPGSPPHVSTVSSWYPADLCSKLLDLCESVPE